MVCWMVSRDLLDRLDGSFVVFDIFSFLFFASRSKELQRNEQKIHRLLLSTLSLSCFSVGDEIWVKKKMNILNNKPSNRILRVIETRISSSL